MNKLFTITLCIAATQALPLDFPPEEFIQEVASIDCSARLIEW